MQKGFEVVNLHGAASGVIAVPVIGENGNWWIGNEDTGIAAQGPKGDRGPAGSGGGSDGTPVGTVIAYMSTKVPDHYLACDGAEYNIEDYPLLSDQILDGFGAVDYFGGDGATTFAVPDLRNEFLRGYHGEAEKELSGETGKHQNATQIPSSWSYIGNASSNTFQIIGELDNNSSNVVIDQDHATIANATYSGAVTVTKVKMDKREVKYTTRPTNVAVLYCIKYE